MTQQPVPLGEALDASGTFVGVDGLAGTVDTQTWTLAGDLRPGAPPRFVRTAQVAATPTWSALGSFTGRIRAIAVDGDSVFIGGDFTDMFGLDAADYLVMWNGTGWRTLGCDHPPIPTPCGDPKTTPGAINAPVYALAAGVDGYGGHYLYAGGTFTNAGGDATADYVAVVRYSPALVDWYWDSLGSDGAGNGAIPGPAIVRAIAVQRSPAEVYVGGWFFNVAGNPAWDYFASFQAALGSWTDGPCGSTPFSSVVHALALYHDEAAGAGSDLLYAAGEFVDLGGQATADYVAACNPYNPVTDWTPLGSNGAGGGPLNAVPYALAVSGKDLYIGGWFQNAGGVATADRVARWNGTKWSGLGSNGSGNGAINGPVYALAFDGTDLYVGGDFTNAAGRARADYVARWNTSAWTGWSSLGSDGSGDGAINPAAESAVVDALGVAADTLRVGGRFDDAAGLVLADNIAAYGPLPAPATMAAPRAAIGAKRQVGSRIPLKISWSGSHPTGISRYRLQESVNGGSWRRVSLASPTQKSITLWRAPGKNYRYRVNATNGNGDTSNYATAATFRLLVRQEGWSEITYSGTWTTAATSYAYGGKLKYARSSSAAAWYGWFQGRAVAWVSTRDSNRGKADVYVDGVFVTTIDLRHATRQPRRTVFSMRWATSGYHQVAIYVKGTSGRPRVDLDAFVILK